MNKAADYEAKSPFCFEPYSEEVKSSFQISCYSANEVKQNPHVPIQNAGTAGLKFDTAFLPDDGDGLRTKLWFATVEDHTFIAKFIYNIEDEGSERFEKELGVVEESLSSLRLVEVHDRKKAIEIDRYEKFMASLSASFDISTKALENDAVVEFMVITANQIDAYLRMSIVLKKQLADKTDDIDIALLFQGDTDSPVMERTIYKQALSFSIIDQSLFDALDSLYKERNKVIHRYIITDLNTRDIYFIAGDYYQVAERVRLALKAVEDEQAASKIGIYKNGLTVAQDISEEDRLLLYSQVNDKHLWKDLARKISK
ncbi:hypothetical protein [Mucilaginibacter rubeus]|uniref:Uncharacterized protein n=1 Tax=Mucilaginibacter rubeus TaxID=2027860 RepID=A0A5C1I4X9_9SPHI|nr:hypothetical protein [Mucilaginibacter rubeus]QEM12959.1 hypothetical protein DEO27_024085 [Mucilaginibacter rubeus]